ncbi:MAG: hypothetical protein IPH93_10965 [Saprospiraceae bacterium]|nr:hypothetical protein [Saprospiraceae bacterium]MBK7812131.1 hypothetical protein [Saprospiraceae bacterium]MBK9632671.1 hypothetical protein [Saprospiraceae bacterium]
MVKFYLLLLVHIFSFQFVFSQDSLIRFEVIYSKKELKKEKKDVKDFKKDLSAFDKAIKTTNLDYINNSLERLINKMDKENLELNARISERTMKVSPLKNRKEESKEDLPKGYNPTIDGQFSNLNKKEVSQKRSETGILMKYGQILNKQNTILRKLRNIPDVSNEVSSSVLEEIMSDGQAFYETLKEEIQFFAKETGKKPKKAKSK